METTSPYTFNSVAGGNVEVMQNGQRISTGTADAASKQYGYVATPPKDPALIVTSGSSRSQYADNVNKMNQATQNIQGGTPATPGLPSGTVKTPAYSLDKDGSIVGMDGGVVAHKDDKGGYSSVSNASGKVLTGVDSSGNLMFGDGATTPADQKDGTPPLDPVVSKQYNDTITASNDTLVQRQADLDAAKATVQNDPAASAALDSIRQKYDILIKAMQDKNKILLGGYQTGQARMGALQFANEMSSNFMSEEMDKANGRISDLVAKENDLLLKTTIAYKTGDIKALNAAQTAYDKANADKLKAINDLVKATNDHVKTVQAQQKIDATEAKQKITDDIRISTNLGKTIADSISASGITDQKIIDQYIEGMATKNGVSSVDVLKSAVVKAQQDQGKLDLTSENTKNNIKNRDIRTKLAVDKANGGGDNSTKTLKTADLNKLGNTLQTGGEYAGRKYNGIGPDGKFDPYLYNSIYVGLKKNVSPQAAEQFLNKHKPEKVLNLDNATNTELEPEIMNRIKAQADKPTKKTTSKTTFG